MRCYFRLGGPLEFDAVGGRTRGVGTVFISDAVLLQTGWPVGVGRGWRTDTGFRTVSFRMRCYFRLGGRLEFDAVGGRTRRGWDCLISDAVLLQIGWPVGRRVGGRTRGLGLSHFGCGVTSDWVASWSLTRLEDGHGGLGLSHFGCGVTSDWVASWS